MLHETDFDPARLLASLPCLQNREPTNTIKFVSGKFGSLRLVTYNGFTAAERIHTLEISRWMQACGIRECPTECSICGSVVSVQYHSENYYSLNNAPMLCKACHFCIHQRFRRPKMWEGRLRKMRLTEGHWATLLPAFKYDLAAYVRSTNGVSELPSLNELNSRDTMPLVWR